MPKQAIVLIVEKPSLVVISAFIDVVFDSFLRCVTGHVAGSTEVMEHPVSLNVVVE